MPVVNGQWLMPDWALDRAIRVPPPIKIRGGKDGWKEDDILKMTGSALYQLSMARGIAMDVENQAVETSGAAEEALASLKASLDKFRSTIANDLTAIKAASARVQSEATQMKQAYQAAQLMLTTPEFERAVVNAERMAVALKSISELSDTKLSVAVFSGGKAS